MDVPDVIAYGVVGSLVGAEHLSALLADTDLVLAVDSYQPYPVAGDASPVAYAGLPGEAVLGHLVQSMPERSPHILPFPSESSS